MIAIGLNYEEINDMSIAPRDEKGTTSLELEAQAIRRNNVEKY